MGKHNTVSGIIVLVVILMIAVSTLMVVNYITGILNAAVAFASSDQVAKIQACGITPPAELISLRDNIPSLFQEIYVGFPGLMVVIAILMFIAGYYYGNGGEAHSSSETTTMTSSPDSGTGRRFEKTQTQKSSSNKEN
jgi:hypothetical protein